MRGQDIDSSLFFLKSKKFFDLVGNKINFYIKHALIHVTQLLVFAFGFRKPDLLNTIEFSNGLISFYLNLFINTSILNFTGDEHV